MRDVGTVRESAYYTQCVLRCSVAQLPLCLTRHHAMNMCGGVEVYLHTFVSSAPDGGDWILRASAPVPLGTRWY